MKDYFSKELQDKLSARFEDEAVANALNYMQERGYIDDEKLSYRYALSKLNNGYGTYYILNKLKEKQIEKDEAFIEEIKDAEKVDSIEYFNKSIAKSIKRYETKDIENRDYKAFISCINHLKGRGFLTSEIMQNVSLSAFSSLKENK